MHTRKALLLSLFLFLLALPAALAQSDKDKAFVGNKNTKKYHLADCRWVEKMSAKNRVAFASVQEAEKAGYVACKVCRPNEKKDK